MTRKDVYISLYTCIYIYKGGGGIRGNEGKAARNVVTHKGVEIRNQHI